MFYRSLFTNAFTACALFSGEIALADSFNISNDNVGSTRKKTKMPFSIGPDRKSVV